MKRGRKQQRAEKDASYELAHVFHGRNPQASWFASYVTWLARPTTDEGKKETRESIERVLEDVGRRDDEQAASFFDDVAAYFRLRSTLPMGIADAPRFFLKSILMLEYRDKPVNYTELAGKVSSESGVPVSERWVSEEACRLGYAKPRRGRPRA